jgi:creatinine amidohydrolase
MIRRYAELRPVELAAALAENPTVICPWGALEWHGPHLPLGLDGLVAESFCERLAEATGGVLLPGCWLPMTTLPHAHSISIPTETVCAVWRALLDECARVGAKTICLVTGHYAQGHELEMYRECSQAMQRHAGLRVIAASPLELLRDDSLLDHAGRSEAAQLLAIRPDLVRLDLYETGASVTNAVLGPDPRDATREEGERLLAEGLAAWKNAMATWDDLALRNFYEQRTRAYTPYRDEFFKQSWEQAIADWWKSRSGNR